MNLLDLLAERARESGHVSIGAAVVAGLLLAFTVTDWRWQFDPEQLYDPTLRDDFQTLYVDLGGEA